MALIEKVLEKYPNCPHFYLIRGRIKLLYLSKQNRAVRKSFVDAAFEDFLTASRVS